MTSAYYPEAGNSDNKQSCHRLKSGQKDVHTKEYSLVLECKVMLGLNKFVALRIEVNSLKSKEGDSGVLVTFFDN